MISLISGIIVCGSGIPYIIRTYQKKIEPNFVTWSIWTLIGWSLLLNSIAIKAFENNPWPIITNVTNPIIIIIIILFRLRRENPLFLYEKISGSIGIISLVLWWFFKNDPSLAVFSLIMALVADISGGVPTFLFVIKEPDDERPFMWFIFGIGYGLSIITAFDGDWTEYLVPTTMFIMGVSISMPLIIYRIKNKIPLKEWV